MKKGRMVVGGLLVALTIEAAVSSCTNYGAPGDRRNLQEDSPQIVQEFRQCQKDQRFRCDIERNATGDLEVIAYPR